MLNFLKKIKNYFFSRPLLLSWLVVVIVSVFHFSFYYIAIKPNFAAISAQSVALEASLTNNTANKIQIETLVENIKESFNRLYWYGAILTVVLILLFAFLIFNSRILSKNFLELKESRKRLKDDFENQSKKMEEINKMTKLVISRDLELNVSNSKLDNKLVELEESKNALAQALKKMKKAKTEAENEKEKTEALVSSFSTPIIFLDSKNKLAMFNLAAGEILKMKEADLGKIIPAEDNFSFNNFVNVVYNKFGIEKVLNEEKQVEFEEISLQADNSVRVYKIITARAVEKDGTYLGVMKIFYDITREKAIDKLKSEFISIAAHQLRTPLSAIKWAVGMVLEGDAGKLNKEQDELLKKGYLSNERIIALVNDLLDVSHLEEGKFGFTFAKTNFQEVIDAALGNLEGLISKNHQKFTINQNPRELPEIYMDKERMIMVLQNLLGNALKYTPEYGKIEMNIHVDGNFLNVKIKDQGVGIPREEQSKLFTKFFRAANAVKLETEGTGLGLFIVKNIIEKHGGHIYLTSEEGKGTEVSFSVPVNNKEGVV